MHVSSRFTHLSVEVDRDDFEVEVAAPHAYASFDRQFVDTRNENDSFADDSFFCDETIESPKCTISVAQQGTRVRRHSKFPIPVKTKRPRSIYEASSSGTRREATIPTGRMHRGVVRDAAARHD